MRSLSSLPRVLWRFTDHAESKLVENDYWSSRSIVMEIGEHSIETKNTKKYLGLISLE
jgi:hypothetical protein